jgi:hypothetical protein
VVQSNGALIALAIFAGLQLDPILNMFTWVCQVGTWGVIGMMAVTSLSVIAFFQKQGSSLMATMIRPAISGPIIAALFVYIFVNYANLTGSTGGSLGWVLPALILVVGVVGFRLAQRLKASDPKRYAEMGIDPVD